MARVTVEDCLKKINSRFELIVLAAKRAHYIKSYPNKSLVEWEDDKATVVSLREIAEGKIGKLEITTQNESHDSD